MSSLSIRLFGYPQIQLDGKPVKVERRKTLALVAFLAVKPDSAGLGVSSPNSYHFQSIGREALAALLWPDSPQEQAQAGLRQALWDFSKAAGEGWIDKDSHAITLCHSAGIWVDVNEFEEVVTGLKGGNHGDQPDLLLEDCLSLYQADFLAGFSLRDSSLFDEWQSYQTEKLRLHLGQLLEILVREGEVQNHLKAALAFSRRWLEVDPYNETAIRSLMRLYEANGQRLAALQQYETFQDHLLTELGIAPAIETTLLYRHIRDGKLAPGTPPVGVPSGEEIPLITKGASSHPTGTVTFIFTDIEGSTRLWENHPRDMQSAFRRHETIVRQTMAAHGGYIYKMVGDAFQIAFDTAPDALAAAVGTQRALQSASWEDRIGRLKVRMVVHTGVTEERQDDYVGPDLNRAGRILSVSYGEQILLSQSTYELARDHLPEGVSLRDLGEQQLKDLAHPEHLYQLVAPDLTDHFPPLKTVLYPSNLPSQSNPFIGRENELAQINALISHPDCRLISLVGIGGCGKTRLAIQAAEQNQTFLGSVYFISLAAVSTREDFIPAIAEAVGCSFHSLFNISTSLDKAQDLLFRFLSDRKALLVLDNLEQLIGCADVISGLISSAPGVKLLVTSRERLNLPNEWVLEIVGLSFPHGQELSQVSQFESVQLFVKTAQRVAQYEVAEYEWTAIARICQLLEGMPLGIEMAAAWTKVLSCIEIDAEIARDFDFLTTSWHGMPERHRTLRAVFDYSWNLLSTKEQDVFLRLAIFPDGFTRQAAFEVVGGTLHLLMALVDKSFLRRVSSGRFEIHPVLKHYADEKLEECAEILATKSSFARFYGNWLPSFFKKLIGRDQLTALTELRAEKHNICFAFAILLEQCAFNLLERLFPVFLLFYIMNDQRVETQAFLDLLYSLEELLREKMISTSQESYSALLALTLTAVFQFKFLSSENLQDDQKRQQTNRLAQESIYLAKSLPDSQIKAIVYMLSSRGLNMGEQAEFDYCQQSVDIFQRLNDSPGVALAQLILADAANFGGLNIPLARKAYQDSLETFKKLGDDWGQSLCLTGLFFIAQSEAHWEEAYALGCQAVDHFERVQNNERLLHLREQVGHTALRLGKIVEAQHHFEANLAYFIRQGDERQQVYYRGLLQGLGQGISTQSV
jgi:predicted ATPase/class 3 adenylate cyclase/DNA-binding SARP family transcriptional activator